MKSLSNFAVVAALVVCMFHGLRVQATEFYTCPGGGPPPFSVDINGQTGMPINLQAGTKAAILLNFSTLAGGPVDMLKPKVSASVFGISIPWDIGQKNACDALVGDTCPLAANKNVTWGGLFEIPSNSPPLTTLARLALVDSSGREHTCCRFDIKIST